MSARTLEILRGARELVAREGGWTQRWFARDAKGNAVDVQMGGATCFCAWGSILRAAGASEADDAKRCPEAATALRKLAKALPPHLTPTLSTAEVAVVNWNDSSLRTREEVVAAFDRAIAAEEAEV